MAGVRVGEHPWISQVLQENEAKMRIRSAGGVVLRQRETLKVFETFRVFHSQGGGSGVTRVSTAR